MKLQELKIYNNLIKTLLMLEKEGYDKRAEIVNFIITAARNNKDLLIDPEICERLAILVDSSNIAVKALDIISNKVEKDFEKDDPTNLGTNYYNTLVITNLHIEHDKYLSLLANYEIYKQENYSVNYLIENKEETKEIEKEIKEKTQLLIKKLNLKI